MPICTGQWAVWNGSASAEYHQAPEHAELFNTEEEARTAARKKGDEIYTEYGVQEISPNEQENGLVYELRDLAERLVLLRTTGRQWKSQHEDDDE